MITTAAEIRAPRGNQLRCKGGSRSGAALPDEQPRPEVAERPADLVVYGGHWQGGAELGCASTRLCTSWSNWGRGDTTGAVGQAGGLCFRRMRWHPRVIIANSNLVASGPTGKLQRAGPQGLMNVRR